MAHAVFFRRDAMFFAPCRQRPAGGLTRAPSENVRDITEEERNGSDMEERKCPQCGAQADPNAKVCIYCGTPLEEAAAPAQPVPPAGAASALIRPLWGNSHKRRPRLRLMARRPMELLPHRVIPNTVSTADGRWPRELRYVWAAACR